MTLTSPPEPRGFAAQPDAFFASVHRAAKCLFPERGRPVRRPIPSRSAQRLSVGEALIAILLLSLGLWWLVWQAFALLMLG